MDDVFILNQTILSSDNAFDTENAFKNTLIILSNLAFLVPGIRCLELKKHVQAFVYFSILVTSSLYHTCKFGADDFASPGGLCVIVGFDVYFVLDHVFATLTIPCLLLSFTPLDVVVFDFRKTTVVVSDENYPSSSSSSSSSRKKEAKSKEELRRFLFENYFSANTDNFYNVDDDYDHHRLINKQSIDNHAFLTNDDDQNQHLGREKSIYRQAAETDPILFNQTPPPNPRNLITAYKPVFEITKKNILDFYRKSSYTTIIKNNMVGLENIYICSYAYLITVSLLISYPNFAFTVALCISSLLVAVFWGVYFYVKHQIVVGFKTYEFFFGLILSLFAALLMLLQDHLPGSTYWITHSIWHVCAALGQWLLLRSKYRFSCYY